MSNMEKLFDAATIKTFERIEADESIHTATIWTQHGAVDYEAEHNSDFDIYHHTWSLRLSKKPAPRV